MTASEGQIGGVIHELLRDQLRINCGHLGERGSSLNEGS